MIDDLGPAPRDASLAMLDGFHVVKHALRFEADVERVLVVDRDAATRLAADLAPDIAEALDRLVEEVPQETLERLAPRPSHTGVVGLARRLDVTATDFARDAPVVALEAPRDLGNVGAVVRVAAAVGAAGVLTTGPLDPWAREALRGSAGLHFALPVLRGDDAHIDGRPLVALDPGGDPFDPRAVPRDAVLAFGTERAGLSDGLLQRAEARLALPMREGVSSLNLATSVSAVLYALRLARE